MRFMGNNWIGLVEEMFVSTSIAILLFFSMIYLGAMDGHDSTDYLVIFIILYILTIGVVRIIRWAIVYNAPIYLFFLHFPAIIAIIIGWSSLIQAKSIIAIEVSSILIIVSVIYFIAMYIKRKEIINKSPPSSRIQIMKYNMKPIEKITLVFPDKYIKFLETGDKRYLDDERGGV